MLILLAAHGIGHAMFLFGKFGAGNVKRHIMMLSEPLDVALGQLDNRIRAAVSWAFKAIVHLEWPVLTGEPIGVSRSNRHARPNMQLQRGEAVRQMAFP